MEANFDKTRDYIRARKKAREIKGLYIHVVVFCAVIPILTAVNLIFVPDFYWFPFSAIGWGTGLLFHWMEVKNITPFFGREWEARKTKQLMDRQKESYEKYKNSENGEF